MGVTFFRLLPPFFDTQLTRIMTHAFCQHTTSTVWHTRSITYIIGCLFDTHFLRQQVTFFQSKFDTIRTQKQKQKFSIDVNILYL